MSAVAHDIDGYLAAEAADILSACTRCGKCAEVCPVLPFTQARAADPRALLENLTGHLAGRAELDAPAASWLQACNGCGDCLPACSEGVNPRKMLLLGTIRESTVASRTPQLFRRMARAIKLMVAMQALPTEYVRLLVPPKRRDVDLVFYVGCNALRTPNLLFNTMYVLDALEADYEVVGGPSSCCGVIATKWEGDTRVGGRVTTNTITRFESYKPSKVLNWCPTCQVHLGETMGGFVPRSYDFDHVTAYLLSRADELQACFTRPIPKRVVLHAHRGVPEVGQNVEALLRRIPGVEVLDVVYESAYTCGGSGCNKTPALRDVEHAELVDRVRELRADALITLYHGCHMAFLHHERAGDFEVLNFTDLLAQAVGMAPHRDQLKQYKLMEDWQSIVAEAQPYLKSNGIEVDSRWLEANGAEIFKVAEFQGGLDCLATDAPGARGGHPHAN